MEITHPGTCIAHPGRCIVLWGGCVLEFTLQLQGGIDSVKINTPPQWKKEWPFHFWRLRVVKQNVFNPEISPQQRKISFYIRVFQILGISALSFVCDIWNGQYSKHILCRIQITLRGKALYDKINVPIYWRGPKWPVWCEDSGTCFKSSKSWGIFEKKRF